jgi:hypothetical protein
MNFRPRLLFCNLFLIPSLEDPARAFHFSLSLSLSYLLSPLKNTHVREANNHRKNTTNIIANAINTAAMASIENVNRFHHTP